MFSHKQSHYTAVIWEKSIATADWNVLANAWKTLMENILPYILWIFRNSEKLNKMKGRVVWTALTWEMKDVIETNSESI